MFEAKIKELISKATKLKKEVIVIEKPKNNFGDYAFPCFILAKKLKKNPLEIAKDLEKKIKPNQEIHKIQAMGPYLNFFIKKEKLLQNILKDVQKKKQFSKKLILVESPGPNTNKPLHVGHIRNLFIGDSVARILEFVGNKVKRVDIINNRGIHICKSMIAYQKFGKNKQPNKKSDHFVGDYYVLYSKHPELEEQAKELLVKWENKDKKTIDLWKKMNKWAIDGIKQTYKLLNYKHDKSYLESDNYEKGRSIVLDGLKKGLFKKKDGAIMIDLGKELGEKILIRSDGTTVYVTQDLYLAKKRYEDYKFDKMIYVVANEQNYHFNVLFKVLNLLGFKKDLVHLSYGMVNLPSGKMKSREGTVIDADELIKEIKEDAKKELIRRYKLSKVELEKRALAIALSAIKFALLKVDIKKDILFDKKEALDFEGFSGPYLQYSYARAASILRKVKTSKISYKNLGEKEVILVKKLGEFWNVVKRASEELKPDQIGVYTYELAKVFNDFYHNCPVLQAKEEKGRRIEFVKVFKELMKNCLELLGIEVLERM
ncbi:MAG: arginine--tRNA ligase [archaeon]